MDITTWLTFVTVISALIVIPGPSSLLITLHGAKYGFKKANFTILGNLCGSFVLMSLSAFGLGALLVSSEFVFSIAKYLGAGYLIYLGIKTIFHSSKETKDINGKNILTTESNVSLFKVGFFTGASNPKDLIFFAALFPAFLNTDSSLFVQLLILMTTWLFVDYLLKVMYLLVGSKVSMLFFKPNFSSWFNRITGGIFVCFGVLLAGYNKN